jgi:hypothetical protein
MVMSLAPSTTCALVYDIAVLCKEDTRTRALRGRQTAKERGHDFGCDRHHRRPDIGCDFVGFSCGLAVPGGQCGQLIDTELLAGLQTSSRLSLYLTRRGRCGIGCVRPRKCQTSTPLTVLNTSAVTRMAARITDAFLFFGFGLSTSMWDCMGSGYRFRDGPSFQSLLLFPV